MLQPFEIFKSAYIGRLLQLNKHYLVTQTYRRASDAIGEQQKVHLLVTDYDDPGLATIHYKAVMGDRYGAIIHLQKEKHLTKLREMLQPDSVYELYWAVVKSRRQLEVEINAGYKDQLRRYITENTNWRVEGNATIKPGVQLIFGELFIVIKHGKQVIRVKFEELEKG